MSKYVTFGIKDINENKFRKVKNTRRYINKPEGGLWASPLKKDSKYICDWERWCIKENLKEWLGDYYIIFELYKNSKIYKVNNIDDLKLLEKKYGEYDKYKDIDITMKTFFQPDFEAIAKDFDGILLTEKGQVNTRIPILNSLNDYKYNLYGWDCATLLLFDIKKIKNYKIFNYD